ncbi:1-phosphofructokinase [Thermanaerothrix daxensis]|nr:1-phosphofructokinase [Thermanaerothrix daxensis]
MMDVVTVTLNPAIDQTLYVDHFQINAVNRMRSMHLDPGGKGVNVASYLADYGLRVAVTGFLGSDNAAIFEQWFARKGILNRFIYIPGRTRTNIKIVDEPAQQTTEINMPGLQPTPQAFQQLRGTLEDLALDCDWFVLSGNLPPGLPPTTYAELIRQLKACGKRVILDTSQEALREGVLAGPHILKPNLEELQQLNGASLPTLEAIESKARELLDHGVEMVIVSMGKHGALFVDAAHTYLVEPPAIPITSTVGAGDAMVAGVLAACLQGLPLEACARLATAFALGALSTVGANLPERAVLDSFVNRVSVRALDSDAGLT